MLSQILSRLKAVWQFLLADTVPAVGGPAVAGAIAGHQEPGLPAPEFAGDPDPPGVDLGPECAEPWPPVCCHLCRTQRVPRIGALCVICHRLLPRAVQSSVASEMGADQPLGYYEELDKLCMFAASRGRN